MQEKNIIGYPHNYILLYISLEGCVPKRVKTGKELKSLQNHNVAGNDKRDGSESRKNL